MRAVLGLLRGVVAVGALVALAGCAGPSGAMRSGAATEPALQSMAQDGVTVSVAVLTAAQARERFGVDLDAHGVQPSS